MVMVILLVLMFGSSSNLAAAYGIAVTGAMLIDGVLISVVLFSLWKWPPWKAIPLLVDLLHHRHALFRRQPAEGARRRLVPAADRRDRLHPAHHLGQGPQADDRADGRGEPADRGVHQVGRDQRRARARHRGVHDHVDDRRAPRAAAQSQAQQGAARAGDAADRADRGCALRRRRTARIETKDYGAGFYRIILRYGFMEEIDVPAALARSRRAGRSSR